MIPGWGAVLRGEASDLETWRQALSSDFDPWTVVDQEDTILRSASLDALSTASEVRARARDMIDYLNGALALSQGTQPATFGGTIKFTSDGHLHRTFFVEGTNIRLKPGKVRFEVRDKDGNLVPIISAPQKSDVQVWASTAENDDLLQEALMYFGKEPTWFNIYKALECLELRFGGGETEFQKLGWEPLSLIKLMKRSANTLRHAKQKFDPPAKPMPLGEATSLLGSLLRRGLQEAQGMDGLQDSS